MVTSCGYPMLQVGGVQEAVTEPAPAEGVAMEHVEPGAQPAAALPATTEAGWEELHVKGALGTTQPWMSTAVADTVCPVPLFVEKLVWLLLTGPTGPNSIAMHC